MNKELVIRMREVFLNGKWIANTNFQEQITSINWEQAVQKIENFNSIALLTSHINYYLRGLVHVFEGGNLDISDKFSFDMPEISSEKEWQNLISEFISNAEKFINLVEKMDEKALKLPFVKEEYGSYLRNIEAQIEHAYYHLGQIVLINKMIIRGIQINKVL